MINRIESGVAAPAKDGSSNVDASHNYVMYEEIKLAVVREVCEQYHINCYGFACEPYNPENILPIGESELDLIRKAADWFCTSTSKRNTINYRFSSYHLTHYIERACKEKFIPNGVCVVAAVMCGYKPAHITKMSCYLRIDVQKQTRRGC